jgi:hypothetical protein
MPFPQFRRVATQPSHDEMLHVNTSDGQRNWLHGRVVSGIATPADRQSSSTTDTGSLPATVILHSGGGSDDTPPTRSPSLMHSTLHSLHRVDTSQ